MNDHPCHGVRAIQEAINKYGKTLRKFERKLISNLQDANPFYWGNEADASFTIDWVESFSRFELRYSWASATDGVVVKTGNFANDILVFDLAFCFAFPLTGRQRKKLKSLTEIRQGEQWNRFKTNICVGPRQNRCRLPRVNFATSEIFNFRL